MSTWVCADCHRSTSGSCWRHRTILTVPVQPIRKPTPRVKERKPLKSRPHVIPASVREDTFARDDYLCQWCRVPGGALHPHHRFLRAQGGRDSVHVLVTVHALCHDAIHTTQIIEAKRRRFIVSTEAGLSEPWT